MRKTHNVIELNRTIYEVLICSRNTSQKRASDLITGGCEPPCGCWELNSGPLKEQSVLLTSEPSLCPDLFIYLFLIVFFSFSFFLFGFCLFVCLVFFEIEFLYVALAVLELTT